MLHTHLNIIFLPVSGLEGQQSGPIQRYLLDGAYCERILRMHGGYANAGDKSLQSEAVLFGEPPRLSQLVGSSITHMFHAEGDKRHVLIHGTCADVDINPHLVATWADRSGGTVRDEEGERGPTYWK